MKLPPNFSAEQSGASEAAIAAAQAAVGRALPNDYLDFMRFSNGGEIAGEIGDCLLCSLEEMPSYQAYLEGTDVTEFVVFGTNGGGELFAFDYRHTPPHIVEVHGIGLSYDDALFCAANWNDFLESPTGFKE